MDLYQIVEMFAIGLVAMVVGMAVLAAIFFLLWQIALLIVKYATQRYATKLRNHGCHVDINSTEVRQFATMVALLLIVLTAIIPYDVGLWDKYIHYNNAGWELGNDWYRFVTIVNLGFGMIVAILIAGIVIVWRRSFSPLKQLTLQIPDN